MPTKRHCSACCLEPVGLRTLARYRQPFLGGGYCWNIAVVRESPISTHIRTFPLTLMPGRVNVSAFLDSNKAKEDSQMERRLTWVTLLSVAIVLTALYHVRK